MGISKVFISITLFVLTLFINSCSKAGEVVGVDIPDDNVIDEAINDAVYYPLRDIMCDMNFRTSQCEDNETNTTVVEEPVVEEPTDEEEPEPTEEPTNKLKDSVSNWLEELSIIQQDMVRNDKNNLKPNEDIVVMTLLDVIPDNNLSILQDTKVVLPYYLFDNGSDEVIISAESSSRENISTFFIDGEGPFKVINSNSIAFLELTAIGEVGGTSDIDLRVQREDSTIYDEESLTATIVDSNETYNPVSLFFTYNTIYIEEDDARRIYFGISYTIDSNVTVVVKSNIDRFFGGEKTIDLTEVNETNGIVTPIISNQNGVPSSFILSAEGQKGDVIDLYLVAVDGRGNYDFAKFTVQIVGKGEAAYIDTEPEVDTSGTADRLTGNDFEQLTTEQKTLVNLDENNIDGATEGKPVITIFNSENPLKVKKDSYINTSFYVADSTEAEIYTAVYDEVDKVIGTIEEAGKFDITYSNRYFSPLRLEAVGQAGEIATITILSQHVGDDALFDQESFKVEIVAVDGNATYIPPMLYFGFKQLFIEEGGNRDGLQFAVSHSDPIELDYSIENESVATFTQWLSQEHPKFELKAEGVSGEKTTLTISVTDGINSDEKEIPITIIPVGTLAEYLAKENEEADTGDTDTGDTDAGDTDTGDTDTGDTDTGDTDTGDTDTGDTDTGDTDTNTDNDGNIPPQLGEATQDPNCLDGYILNDDKTECVSETDSTDVVTPECNSGFVLQGDTCVLEEVATPECETGYELQGNTCVSIEDPNDIEQPSCSEGFVLEDGECVTDTNTERDLTTLPYSDWTEEEQKAESLTVCQTIIDEGIFTTLRAPTTSAEGYSNDAGSLILKSLKTAVVNGVTQNVAFTMIYRERVFTTGGATSGFTYSDESWKIPDVRVDYTDDYQGDTFYIIDEADGSCYVHVFPGANAVPFGVLDYVIPDWAKI